MCLTAFGPASFSEELNIKEGGYNLIFQTDNFKDKCNLHISKESIVLEPIKADFSKITQNNIERLPENLIWADCFYNADWRFDPRDDFCINFFNELAAIAKPHLAPEAVRTAKNQFYIYSGLDQPLIDLVKKYDRENFYVKVATWQGKNYFCPQHPNECDKPTRAHVPKLEIEYLKEAEVDTSKCSKDDVICVTKIATSLKDESLCELLPAKYQGQCFGDVGIAKLDKSLCDKTGGCYSCASECHLYVASQLAIKNNNPDVCKESKVEDDCYINYAKAKKDSSICQKIIDQKKKQKCLNSL